MPKNCQRISIMILIPMLIFTFIVTVKSNSYTNNPEEIIYEYYKYKNDKDICSISKLLYNKQGITKIENYLYSLDEINILSVKEEKDPDIINLYLNLNTYIEDKSEVMAYKVRYSAIYNSEEHKDGEHESLIFLVKDKNSPEWLLDPYDNN
ncbi:DUF4829 domain-containing protein [Romboutsia ilealis]|uniref:DUF4829 domain-containing protein n=1 Tax=Romboutsia faecis TaxID=2764597 RepID=A0ABR7JP33_9FIRM|nr:DUF4829 domain-containing protein [Romboutsia faecis]MBC5996684.1 DUF4829 domain-containing protein [Romboutsia faecis]MRN24210.1 DUF4829 domain-containing protein [Romboutsia ilealis]